ncbi:UbiA family prenyltransferase [Rubrobacter marinus]|uniref:UbiA family prenyltransferase n=1 Tax=Rubrobacter marinus TaxID=2653852 RepID=UPI001A9DD206|nr:UbiA family prenyltransferase [Rubrobacter marinus]
MLLTNVPFLLYFLAFYPWGANLWFLLYAVLFVGYSAPPLRFKARPYLDSLSNAAYAFPLVFVPLALGEGVLWPAALGLMAWSAAKHTFDAVQDIDEDRNVGIWTTAVRLGARGVVLWSGAWWTIATVCFALVNPLVALVNATYAGWLLWSLNTRPTPETGHRLYPFSIAFPYVAGTVAGVQLVAAISLGAYP